MGKFFSLVVAASAGLLLSVSVVAAEGDARLRVDQGKVMVSKGGDFNVVTGDGSTVAPGDRIMVTEGAAATVFYSQDCQREYTVPGVYPYDDQCERAAVAPAGDKMVNWTMVSAIGIGAAVVAVSVGGGGDDDDTPPVSR